MVEALRLKRRFKSGYLIESYLNSHLHVNLYNVTCQMNIHLIFCYNDSINRELLLEIILRRKFKCEK